MKFANPEIAYLYDILVEHDPIVIVRNYRGRLSEIPTAALVDRMLATNSKLVGLKDISVKAPSYSNMSKAELQAAATEKGIIFEEGATKADLIRLLTEADNATI